MLLICFTPFSHMANWRKWVFHHWNPPIQYGAAATEASWFRFDHHEIAAVACLRICGVSIARVKQGTVR